MKQFMKQFLFLLFSLISGGIIFFFVIDEVQWEEVTNVLFLFPLWQIGVIIVLGLLIFLILSYKWKLILENRGCKISTTTLRNITLSSFFIGYLAPILFFANEILVVYFLKKNNVSSSKAISFVFIEKIIAASVYFFLLSIGLFLFIFLIVGPDFRVLTFILIPGLFILFLLVLLSFFYWRSYTKKSILEFFLKIFRLKNLKNGSAINIEREIFIFFNFKDKKIQKIFGVTFLVHIAIFIQHWFLVFFLTRYTLNFLEIFSIYTFIQIAHLFPFPAALGGLELSTRIVFDSLNLGMETAIAFSLIFRTSMLIVALIGGLSLIILLLNLLKTNNNNNNSGSS